jgi:hypothetical protein
VINYLFTTYTIPMYPIEPIHAFCPILHCPHAPNDVKQIMLNMLQAHQSNVTGNLHSHLPTDCLKDQGASYLLFCGWVLTQPRSRDSVGGCQVGTGSHASTVHAVLISLTLQMPVHDSLVALLCTLHFAPYFISFLFFIAFLSFACSSFAATSNSLLHPN